MIRRIAFASSTASGLWWAALAVFGAWGLLSFGLIGFNVDAAQQYERLQELRTLIEKEVGSPTANVATQCKSIAFGSKACGGPQEYLVYSTAKTNENQLKILVNEFNELTRKFNQERKVISDCEFVTEPHVELVGGMCRIQKK